MKSEPNNSNPSCIPGRTENIRPHKNLETNVHSSIIITAKKYKQPKCPPSD